jgi:hypothetical protein
MVRKLKGDRWYSSNREKAEEALRLARVEAGIASDGGSQRVGRSVGQRRGTRKVKLWRKDARGRRRKVYVMSDDGVVESNCKDEDPQQWAGVQDYGRENSCGVVGT